MGTKAPKALWFLTTPGTGGVEYARRIRSVAGGRIGGERREACASSPELIVNANPSILASTGSVAKRVRSTNSVILDVRSREEYAGKDTSQHCARSGRIPGAVWLEWTQLLETLELPPKSLIYRATQRCRRNSRQRDFGLLLTWERGGNTYLALQLLGYARVRNYIGSWHEWASRLDLPMRRTNKGERHAMASSNRSVALIGLGTLSITVQAKETGGSSQACPDLSPSAGLASVRLVYIIP